jgi:hypothetical protein
MGRFLILLGVLLILAGIVISTGSRWPLVNKLGRLPGDIRIDRPGFQLFFPLTTSLLLSLVLTLVLHFLRKK